MLDRCLDYALTRVVFLGVICTIVHNLRQSSRRDLTKMSLIFRTIHATLDVE
jgi:hypothetical protein